MPRSDNEKIEDEMLAMRLLAGYSVDKHGREFTSYLKHNSHEERLARGALSRLVRDDMRGFTGELLALAIDPRTPSATPGMRPTRKIRFESPARGKADNWARDLAVIDCMLRDLHKEEKTPQPARLKRAVATAAKRYGLSVSRAFEIWEQRGETPRRRSGK